MERYKLPDWHYMIIQQKKARIEEIKKEIEITKGEDIKEISGIDLAIGLDIAAVTEYKNGKIIRTGYRQDKGLGWDWGKAPIEKCLPDIVKMDNLQKERRYERNMGTESKRA